MTRRIWFYIAAFLVGFIVFSGVGGSADAAAPVRDTCAVNGKAAIRPAGRLPASLRGSTDSHLEITPVPIKDNYPQYRITRSTGARIVPGDYDTGNHCRDCSTTITLPFGFDLYGLKKGGERGNLPFVSSAPDGHGYITMDGFADGFLKCSSTSMPPNPGNNHCLPWQAYDYSIFGHWDDLDTSCGTCGIFTSVSGSPPSQIFNTEWRAYVAGTNKFVNFEIRLYEDPPTPYLEMFEIIYGSVDGDGSSATVGVQGQCMPGGMAQFTQYSCDTPSLFPGLKLSFLLVNP